MDNILECKICKKVNSSIDSLDEHIKFHKLKKEEYYRRYFPKYDLITGLPIEFKNSEFYLTTFFNSKVTLKQYYKHNSDKDLENFTCELFKNRSFTKNQTYMIGQAESRSIIIPPIDFIEKTYGVSNICKKINLAPRFNYSVNSYKSLKKRNLEKITIDTREQKPLKLYIDSINHKLDFGDYSVDNDYLLAIERKSMTDFISTMSGNYERFCREIEGAKKCDKKIVVLVEECINTCLSFDYIPYYKKIIKAKPSFIFHRMRDLCQKFNNVQFLFCDGRKEAGEIILHLLSIGEKVNDYDLQYLYDTNNLL